MFQYHEQKGWQTLYIDVSSKKLHTRGVLLDPCAHRACTVRQLPLEGCDVLEEEQSKSWPTTICSTWHDGGAAPRIFVEGGDFLGVVKDGGRDWVRGRRWLHTRKHCWRTRPRVGRHICGKGTVGTVWDGRVAVAEIAEIVK